MNPNYLGVVSVILSIVAFLFAYRLTKSKPTKIRLTFTLLAIILAIPGASFAAYYAHVIPESSRYYQFRSITGTELLVVFVGIAGGLLATLIPRVLLILPLFGVMALSVAPIIKPFIGPLADDLFSDKWDDAICLQSTPSTCGAASTVSILKLLGYKETEAAMAKEAHSYAGGTEAWYLARAARSRGFNVKFDFTTTFSPEGGLPSVVGVRLGDAGHFIAILRQDEDLFIVGDPLRGEETMSLKALEKRYAFTGFHMRISR